MANTYLTKTYSTTASSKKILTVSAWVKRSKLGTTQEVFSASRASDGFQTDMIRFGSSDQLEFFSFPSTGGTTSVKTNRVFRDTSAWYHIVVMVNTTDNTAADRVRMYVNGVRETSFATGSYPPQNSDLQPIGIASGTVHTVGAVGTSAYFDGSISHIHYCDGQALDATSFGETDTTTGEWKAKTSPSVTYGNNGFFILKDGNGITDQSGEGNDFTLGGGTLTDLKDNPDNTFATLNPLIKADYASLSNGNNTITGTSASNNSHYPATLQVGTSGKYYYEVKVTANESGGSEYSADGIIPNTEAISQGNGTGSAGFYPKLYFNCQGQIERSNLGTGLADLSGLTSVGTTGIKMFAIDMDNGAIYIGANGTWLNNGSAVGVPTSGGSKTGAMWSFTPSDYPNIAICSSAYNGSVTNYNFGNGYFGTTAITTNSGNGYSGAEGSSKFNYTVPTGYSALSTKGFNE